jgi:origin recognition complex subunit 2
MSSFEVERCERIEASHALHDFKKWRFLLSTNHSLLFYGNGSKYDLLSQFCERELCQEGYCLQIDGFDADVSMDAILDLLVSVFLDGKEPHLNDCDITGSGASASVSFSQGSSGRHTQESSAKAVVDRALVVGQAIAKHCIGMGNPIFLVIHSLDGFLSTDIEQAALATLVRYSIPSRRDEMSDMDDFQRGSCPLVSTLRLVASVDHVDAPAALWNSMTAFDLSWIWNAVHTYRPYIREVVHLCRDDSNEVTTTSQRRQKQQTRSMEQTERVLQVLQNLAPRYGEVMQILAQLQLTELQKTSQGWVDYKALRAACKSRFVIDKDSKLRTLQTELSDHRLLVSKSEGPTEYVSIPYSEDKLREILAFQRNSEK